MPLRRSTVYALDVIAYTGEVVTLDLRVSSGTYVRAIADALGGHCRTLRRTEVGPFSVDGGRRSGGVRAGGADAAGGRARARRGGTDGDAGVKVARRPEELDPARRAVAIGTFDGVHLGHRRGDRGRGGCGAPDGGRDVRPAPAPVLRQPRRDARDDSSGGSSCSRSRASRTCSLLTFDEALATLEPEAFAESILRAARRGGRRGGGDFRFGRGRAGDLDAPRAARIRRPARVRWSRASRRGTSARCSRRGRASTPRSCSAGRAEVEGTVVLGDERGGTLGFPTANLAPPADLLVPALGIYAGSALGHRAAVSIGTNPHYGGTERRIEAYPARLHRRPLRQPGRRRALAAAARRGGLRVRGGADRADRRRRRARRGPPSGPPRAPARRTGVAERAQDFPRPGIFVGMGAVAAKDATLAVLESVRCLECGAVYAKPSAGGTVQKNPGCPTCGYVGWISVTLPVTPRAQRRYASGRPRAPSARSRSTPPK